MTDIPIARLRELFPVAYKAIIHSDSPAIKTIFEMRVSIAKRAASMPIPAPQSQS